MASKERSSTEMFEKLCLRSRPMDCLDILIGYNLNKYDVIALCEGGNCLKKFRKRLKMSIKQTTDELLIVSNDICTNL